MGRLEKSIEIRAPPEKVWEMFALDRLLEWEEGYQKNIKSVEYVSEVRTPEDKYRVGASAHVLTKKQKEFDLEITESLEKEKMTTRSTSGNATLIGTYTLKPTEPGTEVTYMMDYELPHSILGKIIDKLVVGRMMEKEYEKALEKLKSILEK